MFSIIVSEKSGSRKRLDFDGSEVNIGRVQGNDIILPKGNVSKRHSRLVARDGKYVIVDLKSTNGTYVNGRKIASPLEITTNDKIYIGDFVLHLEEHVVEDERGSSVSEGRTGSRSAPPPPPPGRRARPTVADARQPDFFGVRSEQSAADRVSHSAHEKEDALVDEAEAESALASLDVLLDSPDGARVNRREEPDQQGSEKHDVRSKRDDYASEGLKTGSAEQLKRKKIFELQREVHERVIEHLDLRRMNIDRLADSELWKRTEEAIADILNGLAAEDAIPAFVDRKTLNKNILNEALGLGPLEDLLADTDVDEVMVNSADQIYVERAGKLYREDSGFSSDQAVLAVIERIVAPLGRRINESTPMVDARLKDGSRVNAIVPPLALQGPCLTIRKFRRDMLGADDLVRIGTLNDDMVEFLEMCVRFRKNVIVSGGTGSGKTTTLNILSNFISEGERVLTIEDAAELQLKHEHWVQLESRPANVEGKGGVEIRDLVRNALRMRPDRIIVGECRGGEALDMLQSMNTGHDGSLTTAHSNSPRDTLSRLETMVLMSGLELPVRALREQISSAIDIIVHQSRLADGSRRVTHVSEISGMEGDVITMQDIFSFKQEGFDDDGKVRGRFVPSGFIPRFLEDVRDRGIDVKMDIFRD